MSSVLAKLYFSVVIIEPNVYFSDFSTPETYFLGQEEALFEWGSLDATRFLEDNKDVKVLEEGTHAKEVRILCFDNF